MDKHELEAICYKMECGISALDSICTAMEEGAFDADAYVCGLHCVYDYLNDLQGKFDGLLEKCQK